MGLPVTLIQGGGTGLDQVPAVKRILAAAGVAIDWDEHLAGRAFVESGKPALPEELLRSVRRNGLALKTMLMPDPESGNLNVQLRRALGLFATIRPLRNLRGLPARFQGVDMVVIREITEDLYTAVEHEIIPGVVQSIKVVTRAACDRFLKFALEWTRAAGRKTVHCVHKANILKLADGLFLEAFAAAASAYPGLNTHKIIVDNCCQQMVTRPQQFDVLVMGNLYGDLVSDLAAGIVGGASASHGINVGDGVRVYESFHGGSRETFGEDRSNPLPLLLPALDLLEATGRVEVARRILSAIETVLQSGRDRTPDLGGTSTTTAMTDAICAALG